MSKQLAERKKDEREFEGYENLDCGYEISQYSKSLTSLHCHPELVEG
jgi:hypothetical protein